MQAKLLKIIIPVFLIGLVAAGWLSTIGAATSGVISRMTIMQMAAQSYEDGLYQQSILQYKEALKLGVGIDAYQSIHTVYEAYYKEEHNDSTYKKYLNDMTEAYRAYPKEVEFWEQAYRLYEEAKDDKGIWELAKEATKAKVVVEPLIEAQARLSLVTESVSDAYTEVLPDSTNLFRADSGDSESIILSDGSAYMAGYSVMGMPGDDGSYIYVGEYGCRLHDVEDIDRARYDDLTITAAGKYDPATDLVPVQGTDDKWRYLVAHEKHLLDGSYDEAGVYVSGYAAVRQANHWYIIDAVGDQIVGPFEDIKVYPGDGSWLMGGVAMFAKQDGRYAIYDASFNRVGNFTADDIDLAHDGAIAFKSGEKWGYVDFDGTILVEPTFKGAKSFSFGKAAICEEGNRQWGFVDESFTPVTKVEFYEGEYFTNPANALVKNSEDSYVFIGYTYAGK